MNDETPERAEALRRLVAATDMPPEILNVDTGGSYHWTYAQRLADAETARAYQALPRLEDSA